VDWSVIELRQYTVHVDRRDELIELFEDALLEGQEAVGMRLLGQFRDLDRPDRFVWMRAFSDMEARRAALEAFYGGPVWRSHRAAANATMIDCDDVLLLHPVSGASSFPASGGQHRPAIDAAPGTFVATICSLSAAADDRALERTLLPALAAADPPAIATLVEEPSENTFPALPVRTGEHVVVWLQRTTRDLHTQRRVIVASRELARAVLPQLAGLPMQLRLAPTPRSRLR
jgi:hypothetical protein